VKIIVRLARAGTGNGEFISEKLLDVFHEQLLTVMFDQPKLFLNPIVSKEPTKYFSSFWKLGLVFKDRLGKVNQRFLIRRLPNVLQSNIISFYSICRNTEKRFCILRQQNLTLPS
jgi:hypothetical protein